jgi:DNA-binding PadR family transcriptional regulator
MDDLTGFQRDLLVVTAGLDDPNGLDIKDDLEEYYTGEINHGRLYPNLDTLVNKGLLEKAKADERTNRYLLTDRGDRELQSRRDWEDHYLADVLDGEQPLTAD